MQKLVVINTWSLLKVKATVALSVKKFPINNLWTLLPMITKLSWIIVHEQKMNPIDFEVGLTRSNVKITIGYIQCIYFVIILHM